MQNDLTYIQTTSLTLLSLESPFVNSATIWKTMYMTKKIHLNSSEVNWSLQYLFYSIWELGSSQRLWTWANTRLGENDGSETNTLLSAHGSNADSEFEILILTQEEVDEQIMNYIVPIDSAAWRLDSAGSSDADCSLTKPLVMQKQWRDLYNSSDAYKLISGK